MHRFGQLGLLVPAGPASSVAGSVQRLFQPGATFLWVLLEASVLCPYENSVAPVVQFMAEHGYRLIDVTDINRSPKDNVLWLTKLVFLRNLSPLLSPATSYE